MDRMTSADAGRRPRRWRTPEEIAEARRSCRQIYIDEKIRDYIVNIVHATREPKALRPGRSGATSSRSAPARARRST